MRTKHDECASDIPEQAPLCACKAGAALAQPRKHRCWCQMRRQHTLQSNLRAAMECGCADDLAQGKHLSSSSSSPVVSPACRL